MLRELSDLSWDVVCFSETRTPSQDIILEGGHRMISSLGGFVHVGVAILIHQRWVQSVVKFARVSDRVLYLDLLVNERLYKIITVYVPHAGYPMDVFNSCYDLFRRTVLEGQHFGRQCFVGSDFNSEMYRRIRGNRLREFLAEVSLQNTATQFSEIPDVAWTFKDALGQKRILDDCLVLTEVCVESSNSIGGFDLGFDPRCVQSCVLLPPQVHEKVKRKSNKRVNWDIYATVVESSASDRLVTNLAGLEQHAVEVVGKCQFSKCSGTKFWVDTDLQKLREDRHKAVDTQELAHIFIVPLARNLPIFGINQFAYTQKRNRRDMIAFLILSWLIDFPNGRRVAFYRSDVTAAFDRVDSILLLQKLFKIKIHKKFYDVMKSWLRQRKAQIILSGTKSVEFFMENMVFQGTVFGVLLWNIFFESAGRIIREDGFLDVVFADDLNGMRSYASHVCDDCLLNDLRSM